MNYLELKSDIQLFIDSDLGSLHAGATGLLNKACRFIQELYNGRWKHLLVVDAPVTADSTGYLIDLPAGCNIIYALCRLKNLQSVFRNDTDYYLKITTGADLTTAPVRQARFWHPQTANSTMYLTYFRNIMEFSDGSTEQYPDIPGSGDAICEAAKYLGLNMTMDKSNNARLAAQYNMALQKTRELKSKDAGYDIDPEFPVVHENTTGRIATTYNPSDGGYTRAAHGPVAPSALYE